MKRNSCWCCRTITLWNEIARKRYFPSEILIFSSKIKTREGEPSFFHSPIRDLPSSLCTCCARGRMHQRVVSLSGGNGGWFLGPSVPASHHACNPLSVLSLCLCVSSSRAGDRVGIRWAGHGPVSRPMGTADMLVWSLALWWSGGACLSCRNVSHYPVTTPCEHEQPCFFLTVGKRN